VWLVVVCRGAIAELDMLTDLLRVAKEGRLLKLERLDKHKPPLSLSLQLIVAKQGHVSPEDMWCFQLPCIDFSIAYV
jgi:hypothetical protein